MNLRSIVTGIPITLLGGFIGLFIGTAIGGNFIPPAGLEYAHLAGYEGAGLLGVVLGAALASGLWIWKQTKGTSDQTPALFLWAIASVFVLVFVHLSGPTGTNLFWGLIFLPALSPTVLSLRKKAISSETSNDIKR